MSPSEFDLRAALHDGEGEPLDADRMIAAGRAQHARRRAKVRTGIVSAVVVTGVVGIGAAVLSSTQGTGRESAGANRAASSAVVPDARTAAPPAARSTKPNVAAGRAEATGPVPAVNPAAACPTTAPRVPAPAVANPAAPLFPKPVASVLVCAYAPAANKPAAVTLTGETAQQLVDSLETAARTKPSGACPSFVLADQRQLTIIARSTDGTALPPVTTTLNAPACRVVVTNGAAVRYGWTPSAGVAGALRSVAGTPQRLHGSPAVS